VPSAICSYEGIHKPKDYLVFTIYSQKMFYRFHPSHSAVTLVVPVAQNRFDGRAKVSVSVAEQDRAETGVKQNWNVRHLH
jgi:hypothetical protein